jgi:hypothetical protein
MKKLMNLPHRQHNFNQSDPVRQAFVGVALQQQTSLIVHPQETVAMPTKPESHARPNQCSDRVGPSEPQRQISRIENLHFRADGVTEERRIGGSPNFEAWEEIMERI